MPPPRIQDPLTANGGGASSSSRKSRGRARLQESLTSASSPAMAANEHSRPAQRRWMFVCVACAMHVYVAAVAQSQRRQPRRWLCVCVPAPCMSVWRRSQARGVSGQSRRRISVLPAPCNVCVRGGRRARGVSRSAVCASQCGEATETANARRLRRELQVWPCSIFRLQTNNYYIMFCPNLQQLA